MMLLNLLMWYQTCLEDGYLLPGPIVFQQLPAGEEPEVVEHCSISLEKTKGDGESQAHCLYQEWKAGVYFHEMGKVRKQQVSAFG